MTPVGFTTPLDARLLADGKWRLIEPFVYYRTNNTGDRVLVFEGFVTDFASIPKIFRNLIDIVGRHGKAAVIHDFLYFSGKRSRKEADDIFLEGMVVLQVGYFKRYAMYWGVRSFGWAAWNEHRKRKENWKEYQVL